MSLRRGIRGELEEYVLDVFSVRCRAPINGVRRWRICVVR